MNFNEEDEASFFKILLSDSVDYLPLPTAFAKKYLGKANNKKQTLFVETKPAVKWSVKYVKIEDKYYFMDGWLNFMKDNCLQKGDLLVFWLRSPPNFMFQVFFFAPNGCLKHPISSSGACDGMKLVVKEGESNDDDESDDFLGNVQNCSRRVLRISCLYRMPLTNAFWNTAGIDGYGSVLLRNDERKMWKVVLTNYQRKGRPLLGRGWSDFRKANKIQIEDICIISHVKRNLLHVHVIKKQKKGNLQQKTIELKSRRG